jgi:hypothetical protein
MPSLEFKKSYVAFLDILGFKEKLNKVNFKNDIEQTFANIEEAITKATKPTDHGIYPEENISYSVLSDSIILSIPFPKQNSWKEMMKSLRFLLSAVEKIQYKLSLKDTWLRGAISEGELSHDTKNVIGKGLVQAYLLEKESIFPRVLVDSNIFKEISDISSTDFFTTRDGVIKSMNDKFNNEVYSGKFLFAWNDGQVINKFQQDYPFFVNYLNPLLKEENENERNEILNTLKPHLFIRDPSIYEKYRWVIDYLRSMTNQEIHRKLELKPIKDPLTDEVDVKSTETLKNSKYLEVFFDKLSTM